MPTVQRELIGKGTTFENGILTLPVCCPSRATMLRGQYAHNHSLSDGSGGENGARWFRKLGLENSTVATWLNKVGYRTALMGKYLNGYDYRYVPSGWDSWHANVGTRARGRAILRTLRRGGSKKFARISFRRIELMSPKNRTLVP
jgi:N-acetylglucosamine-6-sulfatase